MLYNKFHVCIQAKTFDFFLFIIFFLAKKPLGRHRQCRRRRWGGKFLFYQPLFWRQRKQKYRCYYPHQLSDSVSPVCGIFVVTSSRTLLLVAYTLPKVRRTIKTKYEQINQCFFLLIPVYQFWIKQMKNKTCYVVVPSVSVYHTSKECFVI